MKIGAITLKLRSKPDDVAAQLETATGCSPAEIAGWLGGNPIAGLVAAALVPFIEEADRPAIPELATAIADAGVGQVAAEVAGLYAKLAPQQAGETRE